MDGKGLRWNQTSFKKLSKLIKYLDEKKVIVVKEVNKQPVSDSIISHIDNCDSELDTSLVTEI